MPRFFAFRSDAEETMPFAELSSTSSETIKLAQKPQRSARDRAIPLAEIANDFLEDEVIESSRPGGNWHKIVDSRPRTPSTSRTAIPALRRPLPLPPEHLPAATSPRPPFTSPRQRQPSLFFWISILVLFVALAGSLLGVVLGLGHGALAQKSSHAGEITLQVTPATVALGNVIELRGSNFSPHGQIGLTRDSNIPIADTVGNTIIQADSKGSFAETVIVEAEWQAGSHLIRAEDAKLHKTAAFTIAVTGHSPSLRPPHLVLSSSAIDLGAGDQATNSTKTITLTNGGGGQITWQSVTTHSWLLLSPKSGTFSSGQRIQLTIAANRSNLLPGAYAAGIIFTSNAGQEILSAKMRTTQLEPGHEADLQLTPAVLSLTGVDGSSDPPAQVLTVSNPGVLPLHWSASSSSNWLSITPWSGDVSKGSSQSVQVGVNISTQLPGTYTGVVTFTGSGLAPTRDSPQNVYVSLTIVPKCALQLSPGALAFSGAYLQPGPGARAIRLNVTQGCSTPLHWNALVTTKTGGHWLNIGRNSGTTPSSPAVSVNATGLKPGVYSGSIIFSCSAGTLTLPVSFTIGQHTTPMMTTTPATMVFSATIGQTDPAGQAVTITNSGGGTLNWQVSAATNFGGAWLSVAPASGILTSHQSATVNVSVILLNGLTPITYTGMVTITGTDGSGHITPGSPQMIPVNFVVQAPCTIVGTPSALSFAGVVGQPTPLTQAATISASGTCTHTLNWTASTGNTTWLTRSPTSGTVSVNSSSAINIGIVLSGLSPNTYTGQVTITATDSITHQSVGTPQTVEVTLTVNAAQSLTVSPFPNGLTINVTSGTTSQAFSINNTGSKPLNWTAALGVDTPSFVSLSAGAGTNLLGGASVSDNVIVNATGVPGGTSYSTTVTASTSNPITGKPVAGSPAIPITINIAPPVMQLNTHALAYTASVGVNPQIQSVNLTNSGGDGLTWKAHSSGSWLKPGLTQGSDNYQQTSTIPFEVDATGLASGFYTATVAISPSVGAAQTVTVTLTIT